MQVLRLLECAARLGVLIQKKVPNSANILRSLQKKGLSKSRTCKRIAIRCAPPPSGCAPRFSRRRHLSMKLNKPSGSCTLFWSYIPAATMSRNWEKW